MVSTLKFKNNEKVLAKKPKTHLYICGRIITHRKGGYDVLFEDGTVKKTLTRNIKKLDETEELLQAATTVVGLEELPVDDLEETCTSTNLRQRNALPSKSTGLEPQADGYHQPITPKSELLYGGTLGTLLICPLIVIIVLGVNLACRKDSCTLLSVPEIKKMWISLINPSSAAVYLGFCVFQGMMLLIPIGKKEVCGNATFRCNGLLALTSTFGLFGGCIFWKVPLTTVYDDFFALITTSLLFSFILSTIIYISGRNASSANINPLGNAKLFVYDWFVGKEMSPTLGPLHVKMFLFRVGFIGWGVVNAVMVLKHWTDEATFSGTLTVAVSCQFIYIIDMLWHEGDTTFTLLGHFEGTGFAIVSGFLSFVPFINSLTVRFVYTFRPQMDWPLLTVAAVLFLIGYSIFRLSSNQKSDFRRNPRDPKFRDVQTIFSQQSKKYLLVSGWWGFLRHPNYLGELLMAIAWTLPCGFTHIIPWFYILYLLPTLLHRAGLNEQYCLKKHTTAWTRYVQIVKYRLVPFIF